MKLMPSSTTRRSVAMARSRLGGSPQIPRPVIRIAPNPSRLTVRSPPTSMVPAAAAVGCASTRYLLLVTVSLSWLPPRAGAGGRVRAEGRRRDGPRVARDSGADESPGLGQLYRLFQGFYVIGAVMPLAVDEERRGPGHIGQVGGFQVFADASLPGVLAQVGGEPVGVEAERVRVPDQVPGVQGVLVVQQQVVHLPERALPGGCLGGLGRELSVRVHVGQRQVPPHVPDL